MTTQRTYKDWIGRAGVEETEVAKMQAGREVARGMASRLTKPAADSVVREAVAFGMLDVIAVRLVEWFGASAAGEVFRHFAEVCEGRAGK